ncbi:unnamed protein product [Gulo gulo]|uniref:Uncharacterized protein n=1 Tax=Gulo gulo TaxID=48420 RepID=A0A9X9LJA3_GULGU|nr:unnamed protein product [Gulo gulo]
MEAWIERPWMLAKTMPLSAVTAGEAAVCKAACRGLAGPQHQFVANLLARLSANI